MIQSDRSKDTDGRIYDVRRVKPSAQPHFDDGHVDIHLGEMDDSGTRSHFKLGRLADVAAGGPFNRALQLL